MEFQAGPRRAAVPGLRRCVAGLRMCRRARASHQTHRPAHGPPGTDDACPDSGSRPHPGGNVRRADLLRRAAGTPSRLLPSPRILSAAQAARSAPGIPGLRGGLEFHDGQLNDDARLVVAVARTAASHGAAILTHVRATRITARGVNVVDGLTGESGEITARAVVHATGVWAAGLAPELVLRPSRGTHVVLDSAALPGLRTN